MCMVVNAQSGKLPLYPPHLSINPCTDSFEIPHCSLLFVCCCCFVTLGTLKLEDSFCTTAKGEHVVMSLCIEHASS